MVDRKTTIRVALRLPHTVVAAVDEVASRRGETRSRLVGSLLGLVAAAKRDQDIASAIQALFQDDDVREEQARTAEAFMRAGTWQREA